MINVAISGSWPQLRPLSGIMEQLSAQMERDVLEDVANGGNPTWQQRIHPPGQATLDYIPRTLTAWSDAMSASVGWGAGLVYPKVHEMGWEIRRSEAMKGHFWKVWYASNKTDEFAKGMAISNKPTVTIPQRSEVSGFYGRTQEYIELLGEQIMIIHHVPINQG